MYMAYCVSCLKSSKVIGQHPNYGNIYRCSECGEYWERESTRTRGEDGPPQTVPVIYGRGELGLANALKCGCQVDPAALFAALNV